MTTPYQVAERAAQAALKAARRAAQAAYNDVPESHAHAGKIAYAAAIADASAVYEDAMVAASKAETNFRVWAMRETQFKKAKASLMAAEPYTLNVLYADGEIATKWFADKADAVNEAREEVKWENTVHATVTHEPTGEEVYDGEGEFHYPGRVFRA